jgi:hypothetical protein
LLKRRELVEQQLADRVGQDDGWLTMPNPLLNRRADFLSPLLFREWLAGEWQAAPAEAKQPARAFECGKPQLAARRPASELERPGQTLRP